MQGGEVSGGRALCCAEALRTVTRETCSAPELGRWHRALRLKGSCLMGDLGNGMGVGKGISGRMNNSLRRQIMC